MDAKLSELFETNPEQALIEALRAIQETMKPMCDQIFQEYRNISETNSGHVLEGLFQKP
jgi:inorganic pyrophosphatase